MSFASKELASFKAAVQECIDHGTPDHRGRRQATTSRRQAISYVLEQMDLVGLATLSAALGNVENKPTGVGWSSGTKSVQVIYWRDHELLEACAELFMQLPAERAAIQEMRAAYESGQTASVG